jgi:hypothetical protein
MNRDSKWKTWSKTPEFIFFLGYIGFLTDEMFQLYQSRSVQTRIAKPR